jgi:hypothetical protein
VEPGATFPRKLEALVMTWIWQLVRIGIDAMSFFCVTTDLYGVDRLEELTGRLHGFFSSTKVVIVRLFCNTWLVILAP